MAITCRRLAVLAPVLVGILAFQSTPGQAGATGRQAQAAQAAEHQISWGKPVFRDSFSGHRLSRTNWSVYDEPHADGNHHPRRTPSSVRVRNGSLQLIGHFQKGLGYVSGGVSYNTNQTYGRWVIRFRADAGAGYAPVVLLWPRSGWPLNGEIDMAEITNPARLGGGEFLHLGAVDHKVGHPFPAATDFTRWHTVAVDWLPDHVSFWLDGTLLWTQQHGTGDGNFIPSTPFHLALQNDQGCDNGCKPDRHTPRRVIMRVDWVRVYAAPASQPRMTLHDPGSAGVRGTAYSPSGQQLATADGNGHVYIWSASTGRRLATLTDPASKGVRAAAYSPDGRLLAAADGNGQAYLWAVPGYRLRTTLADPGSGGVNAVAFTTLSHFLATADANGHTYVWAVSDGSLLASLPDPARTAVTAASYSPDGRLLATADRSGHASIWALPDYKLKTTLANPDGTSVNSVAFTTLSHFLATADSSGNTHIWDIAQAKIDTTLRDSHSQARGADYSPDGTLLGTADSSGHISVLALPDYKLLTTLSDPLSRGATAISFSPGSRTVAVSDRNGNTYLFRAPAAS